MRPLFARTIPTELHPIFIGIAQVKRLAYPMIGGAIKLNASADYAPERIAQVGTRRVKNGQMIKTGRSGRRWRTAPAFPGIKTDVMMIASGRNERGFLTKTGDEFEPE